MEQSMVPEIDGSNPLTNPDAAAMALTGNTMADLSAIAKEMGVTLGPDGNPVEAPAQSAPVPAVQPPAPAPVAQAVEAVPAAPNQTAEQPPAPVEVPAKFQNPDGTVNVEKLDKSTRSIDEALAYYKAKERELSQAQNRVNNPPAQPQYQPPQAPVVPQFQTPAPLEIQVAQDILNETAALQAQGYQPAQAQALATARVQVRLAEAKYNAEMNATSDIRREMQEAKMAQELGRLIASDNSLVTPEVADRLIQIKQELGLTNFDKAYAVYLGEQEIKRRTQQVPTPTPKGATAKAPPTPVSPVARVQKTVDITDKAALKSLDIKELEALAKAHFPGYRGK